jgi:hypothetical protein
MLGGGQETDEGERAPQSQDDSPRWGWGFMEKL